MVREAYRRRQGRSLDEIYADRLSLGERLRWRLSLLTRGLEELPPFWSSYALTLTQTVGAGVLALPIALGAVGPLPGVVLIVVLGLINVLTVAAVAEAFARTGEVRWGGAFFGRLVNGYLGRAAGGVLTVALALISMMALLAYYIGLSTTMADATKVPAPVWAAALFAVGLAVALRRRLDATVTAALLVGAVNLVAIAVLTALAVRHLEPANLGRVAVPFVGGRPFEPAALELIFGVVLIAFFGHTSVGSCARVVLAREPGGRALIRGATAAMATAVVLYAVWVLAVGGAVDPDRLAAEPGTALAPLAEVAGPAVVAVGTVFAILAMGMASVNFSVGLVDQARELLARWGRLAGVGSVLPVAAVFVTGTTLLVTDRESFAGPLGLVGTVIAPVLAGVFPVLLLVASRRRGNYVPDRVPRLLGRPAVAAAVFAVFAAALLAHGLFIWSSWTQRAIALAVFGLVLAISAHILRSGALTPLATVELRRDRDSGLDLLQLTANGRRLDARVRMRVRGGPERAAEVSGAVALPPGLLSARVDLARVDAAQLRVWVHEVDLAGGSEPLPATVALIDPDGHVRRPGAADRATTPLDGGPVEVEIVLGDGRTA
jgi:amino acid permease